MASKSEKGMPTPAALAPIHRRAAGVDISATLHVVAVPIDLDPEPVRSFRSFTGDLNRLADWLVELSRRRAAADAQQLERVAAAEAGDRKA